MPVYDFACDDCQEQYCELTTYDDAGIYPGVSCPKCGSAAKRKKISSRVAICGTDTRMGIFSYRAGHNMERAKGERRAAEAASHMGSNPYTALDDTPRDIGIHDNEAPIRL
jgi:putative FmdB family regulatory protein